MERSGPECITFQFGVMFWNLEFDVWSCAYLCIFIQLSALYELCEWSGLRDVTVVTYASQQFFFFFIL